MDMKKYLAYILLFTLFIFNIYGCGSMIFKKVYNTFLSKISMTF
jgi:hypothetical protein